VGIAVLLSACRASLDLDDYVFERGEQACAEGDPACSSPQLPACNEQPGDDAVPCRDAPQPCDGPDCPARSPGGLSTVLPGAATSGVWVSDARIETLPGSCGSWRGERVCVRGQISD
jgi:hypothetical protein